MPSIAKIRIWDPLVRVFHWTLAAGFTTAYLTQEDFLPLHSMVGYLVAMLIAWRIAWGFIGTRHARFCDFVTSPTTAWRYLMDTLRRRAQRHLGHNPAGGAMVVLLLACVLMTAISGIALYGISEQAGPLAVLAELPGTASTMLWQDRLEGVHEVMANLTLILVIVHVSGVIVESLIHRENLVRAMFDGRKYVANSKPAQEQLS
jgi:cytochrome b